MITFKNDSFSHEFDLIDKRLQLILFAIDGYCSYNFGISIQITELLRTQEMQDLYYKDNTEYQKVKFTSVHQVGRGADISIKNMKESESDELVEWINTHVAYNKSFRVALNHNVGYGRHIHIQVDSDGVSEIKV